MFLKQSRLNSINFNEEEILKIIRALNIRKAHGHDDLSIRMIKICDKSLLILLFKIQLNHTVILTYEKDLISFLCVKIMINNQLITTNQYLFSPFLEKYLKYFFQ